MERFLADGLGGVSIGYGSYLSMPGSYLVDMNSYTAEYVEKNARGHTVRVCMTSIYDLAQFVVAAIDLGPANWPRELTMRGDRLSVRDVVGQCSRALNGKLQQSCRETFMLTAQPLSSFPSGRPQTLLDLQLPTINRAILPNSCSISSSKLLLKDDMTLVRRP